jgi:uncharacterized membrane protein
MKRALPAILVALSGAAIDVFLFAWVISFDRDYLLGEINLVPLMAAGLLGACLTIGGIGFAVRNWATPT